MGSCGTTLLCDDVVSQLHTTHSEYFLIDIYNWMYLRNTTISISTLDLLGVSHCLYQPG